MTPTSKLKQQEQQRREHTHTPRPREDQETEPAKRYTNNRDAKGLQTQVAKHPPG